MKSSRLLLRVMTVVWLLGTVFCFWHLEGRYLLPVVRPAGASSPLIGAKALPLRSLGSETGEIDLTQSAQITFLNFWDPTCPCSRFNEPHLRQLQARGRLQGVRFVTVIECAPKTSPAEAYKEWQARGIPGYASVADPGSEIARRLGVWAAPGAVILDRQARIVYVGGFNAARFCDNDKTAWAKMALEAVLRGQSPPHPTMPFYGCQVIARRR